MAAPEPSRPGSREGGMRQGRRGADITAVVERARRRLGLARGLAAAVSAGLWLLPAGALARFGLLRLGHPFAEPRWMVTSLGVALGAAFSAGYLSRPSRLASALQLDQGIGARGTLAAAFELGGPADSTGYVELVLASAERQLVGRDLKAALPLAAPPGLRPFVLTFFAFLVALFIQPDQTPLEKAPLAPLARAAEAALPPLSADELALLAQRAQRLLSKVTSEEGKRRALDYAALVDQLERGTIDRKQALSAIAAAVREVSASGAESEQPNGQSPAGESRKPDEPSGTQGDQSRQLKDSAEALRRLAERLSQETTPPTARELERIRETLERAKEQSRRAQAKAAGQADRTAGRLKEKERRLLEKQKNGSLTSQEARELEHTQRQLEQLERQKRERERSKSELDRQIEQAMRELAAGSNKAREFLDRSAGSMDEQAGQQLTEEEKRELLEELRALKERLRQGEETDVADQLRDFERRARGGQSQGERGQGEGQPASGTKRRLAPGSGQSPGSGSSPAQAERTELGPSASIEPGTEHDPNWQGEASERLAAKTHDKAAAARDSGAGKSDSETILTAAERGFTSGAYERIYRDYQTVLEEMVSGEAIPRGRRTEVERYFDLIRPREN